MTKTDTSLSSTSLRPLIETAISHRSELLSAPHQDPDLDHLAAGRLFNGFYEGFPDLVIDLYARTLVFHNYSKSPDQLLPVITDLVPFFREKMPWVQAMIVKSRYGNDTQEKNGHFVFGNRCDRKIIEHGISYAINLTLNQDSSFYLDTSDLRLWLKTNLQGKDVLNTFAYTGSLGVAAMAGGAKNVVHCDLNKLFLNLAKDSYSYATLPIQKANFLAADFWVTIKRLKKSNTLFDCVILDPPYFAKSRAGVIDMSKNATGLINKVRPLIRDGGYLVVINNALFLSGAEYMSELEQLCESGYLSIETVIPVPESFLGSKNTRVDAPPIDPAPFNHSTKIVILRVKRD